MSQNGQTHFKNLAVNATIHFCINCTKLTMKTILVYSYPAVVKAYLECSETPMMEF